MIEMNCSRRVSGLLRGFDAFLNVVLEDAVEESIGAKPDLGLVVIRGNSIHMVQALDRL